jgi:hypothetical protein
LIFVILEISTSKVLHSEHEISQFADDTSVILDGSEKSLNETRLELECFKKISGLKIIFSKTQVIWIGSKKHVDFKAKIKECILIILSPPS